ncbi:MAG: hydroxyacid dehydrogenase [Ruminococcaceae bacterium]|nr:hydroxyacid dehydrogenase [Oscillospiraceae bacterium]
MKALVAIKRDKTFETFFTKENVSFAETLGEIVWLDTEDVTEDILKEKIKDCDVYVTCWGSPPLTPKLLECAPNLRLHTHLGSTVAPVVCNEVCEKGIRVISGFDYYSKSTAEGVVAYSLAALRKIPFFSTRLKKHKIWSEADDYTDGIIGKKVGIVGFGGVGRYIAKMLSNFDVNISAYDIAEISKQDKKFYGVEQCGIEEIFSTCDIISLNLPYNDSTYHIVDDALLSKIKQGALLVNTARGAIIDETALIKQLQKGNFNAVLDVYEKEPIDMESPLLSLDNALLLPHQAGPTVNLRAVITKALIKESADFIDGNLPLKNEISAERIKNMSKF